MKYHQIDLKEGTMLLPIVPDVRKVYIEASSLCNFSCITCMRHSWEDSQTYLSWELFSKFLQDAKELPDLTTIHFGGFGEPFTNPNLLAMVRAAKDAGYQVEMITNGSYLTPAVCQELVDIGLDWIFVSLDGPDSASFEQIRPGSSYDEVSANIRELQRIKEERQSSVPQLGIEFVATKQNINKFAGMGKVIRSLKADQIIVTNVLPYHSNMKDEILYGGPTEEINLSLYFMTMPIKTMPNMKLFSDKNCKFMDTKALAITAAGEVCPCYALMHTYTCFILGREKKMFAHSFGNIGDRTIKDIWTDERYMRFRWIVRNNRYPSCIDCRLADGCVLTNESDCWGNEPSCGDCLWSRNIVMCP